jgi:sigma-B regulation protein RsbU (phosphoserine phosphatase)
VPSRIRPHLRPLSWLFAATTLLYAGIWLYAVRLQPRPRLGIEAHSVAGTGSIQVDVVRPESPAAVAGLREGDEIVALDGQPPRGPDSVLDIIRSRKPGGSVQLSVNRLEEAGPTSLEVELILAVSEPRPFGQTIAIQLVSLYPVPFVVVGLSVLLLRPDERNAWLMALVFAGFVAGAQIPQLAQLPSPLRKFCLGYQITVALPTPALFFFFFSVFPGRSLLDRRWPWLKWSWLGAAVAMALPAAIVVAVAGSTQPLEDPARSLGRFFPAVLLAYSLGGFLLGLGSLLWNVLRSEDQDVRRKGRVIVWGTLLGLVPGLLLHVGVGLASMILQRPVEEPAFWVWAPAVVLLSLMPLSYAYAVVKHRVLEVPVLLRQSARYLLVQRGAVGVLVTLALGITLLVARAARLPSDAPEGATAVAFTLGAGFGTLLAWGATRLHRQVRERIDRAFFRRTYDVHHVLQELAIRIRSSGSREEIARLLEEQISAALLPRSLAVYLEGRDGRLHATAVPEPLELPGDLDPPEVFTGRERSADISEEEVREAGAFEPFRPLEPECLVPVNARDSRLSGLVVLGPRLSEEPYSGEDRRLLESVAGQAGLALEGIRLAEEMADRLETQRLTDHELRLAGQVQRRLLPQGPPNLETLECVGGCLQARAVGGDYYDFLDLGPGRVGLVLADISGKGFSAALLMASLQASLRSRSAQAGDSLAAQLEEVNQLLHEASQTHHYATLFVGVYDDATRRLHYANCGHNPPFLLRAGGEVERLAPTGMVIGLITPWSCETADVELRRGDTLVVFTDGVTDALSDDEEEFGEQRLLKTLQAHIEKPVAELLGAVVDTVRRFSGSEQEDDLTLLLARAR